jgi:hypothetical protein
MSRTSPASGAYVLSCDSLSHHIGLAHVQRATGQPELRNLVDADVHEPLLHGRVREIGVRGALSLIIRGKAVDVPEPLVELVVLVGQRRADHASTRKRRSAAD